MEGLSKYTLLAQASVEFLPPPRATAFFLPTPAFPPETYVTLRPSSSWSRYPVLALSGTSKPLESNRIIQTKTLQAPLASFAAPNVRSAPSRTEPPVIFREDDGLLCLERVIPNEISRRLERLAKAFNPFKVEAYRGGLLDTTEHWLDTLIEPFLAGSISSSCFRDPSQHQRVTSSDRVPQAEKNVLSVALNSEELAEPIEDAVIWLRDDISNVAKLFAQEVAGWSASWPRFDMTVKGQEGGEVGLTVKLELLRKGKCPRYHLDKVPLRLICTYLGPSTEWLDGYDGWEMHNNRSPPPECNLKISGGVEARRANEGDVLIFRGQPPQSTEPVGVAHCSPDMEEGQRRLVLTIDIGDMNCGSGATTVASKK